MRCEVRSLTSALSLLTMYSSPNTSTSRLCPMAVYDCVLIAVWCLIGHCCTPSK